MDTQIEKLNDTQVKVTTTETVTKENVYSLDELLARKEAIQKKRDSDNAARDAEEKEVDSLIGEAQAQGVMTQVEYLKQTTTPIKI